MTKPSDIRVLIACEQSGTIREEFTKLGFDAWSCDLIESDVPGQHIVQSALEVMYQGWDLMIGHPPCTHLSVSGAAWFAKKIADGRQQAALDFVRLLMKAPVHHIAIENPVSIIGSKLFAPTQTINPWQFGDEFQKTTCLWLKNLPKLKHTKIVDKGEFIVSPSGKRMPRWYSDDKSSKGRSKTFPGIAKAIAEQWGEYLVNNKGKYAGGWVGNQGVLL